MLCRIDLEYGKVVDEWKQHDDTHMKGVAGRYFRRGPLQHLLKTFQDHQECTEYAEKERVIDRGHAE